MSDSQQAAPQFPQSERPALRSALESGGWAAVEEYAAGWAKPRQRIQLFSLATRIASGALRSSFTLDQLCVFNDAAIGAALTAMEAAQAAGDAEAADGFKQQANVMAYNFAADLAPCWPGDDEAREQRHYARGVELGRQMLRWRIELNMAAENFALAYWALGIHQLGLGEFAEAAESFGKAQEHSRLAAEEYGRKPQVAPDGDWQVILNSGYRGLARALAGDADGQADYRAALAAFRGQADEQPELADDAQFGIAQLEQSARVFGLDCSGLAAPPCGSGEYTDEMKKFATETQRH